MKQLTINELKIIELNILIKIDKICRTNKISYSLCGGTLLGAVRHKGFIPWDDDIDITMTRSNYDKFVDYMKNNTVEGLKLIDCDSKNYGYMFSKVCDTHTKLVEHHNKFVENLGVFVDIFPVDYLDDTFELSNKIMASFRFKKYLLTCWNWKRFYINKAKNRKRQVIRFIFFIMSRFASRQRLIKKMNDRISMLSQERRYSGCLFGSYDSKDIFETKMFTKLCDIEFEGHLFMCFQEYDEYLRKLYGDYMKLPPKEKQITHHTFDAFVS